MLAKLSGLFYGWRMVGAASALRVLGAGLHSFGFTVFFLPLSQDLNINRTATSLAFSLARAEGAIEGPIVGHLLDRYGPKPIMLTAALLMGVGYLILSQVDSYASFLIVYLGIISLVHAGGFMHAPMVLINTWFIRQRARAITLNSAAFGLGGVLIAPLLSLVVQAWGWRWGAVVAGVTFLVVGIPICLTIRRSPESMGLLPDGDAPPDAVTSDNRASQAPLAEPEVTLAQALRSFAFWGSVLANGVRNASYHAVSVHFIPMMIWKGLSQQQAAWLLSAFAFLGMAATLGFGWYADRAHKPRSMRADIIQRRPRHAVADLHQLVLAHGAFHHAVLRRRSHVHRRLGDRRRSVRPQTLRQDSRLHGTVLHLGRRLGTGDGRRRVRSLANLPAAALGADRRLRRRWDFLRQSVQFLVPCHRPHAMKIEMVSQLYYSHRIVLPRRHEGHEVRHIIHPKPSCSSCLRGVNRCLSKHRNLA